MSQHAPKLAVVIPSRNSKKLTLDCLGSLRSGGVGKLEVWVVDDGSDDGTRPAIEKNFPEVGILRSEHSRGFTVSANAGLNRAETDLLLLLNSDTQVLPGSLEALKEAFDRDENLGIAGGSLHYPDGSSQWSGGQEPSLLWLLALASGVPALLGRIPGYRNLRPLSPVSDVTPVDWVTGAAMAMRKEVWRQIGPLDEQFRFYCQDLDFCRRAAAEGWKVALLAEFPVLHHHGATIGRQEGTNRDRQHPELLWTDLVRWAHKQRGPKWASRALRALQVGGRLRLLGRSLTAPFAARAEVTPRNRDTEALQRALEALRHFSSATLP